MTSQTDTLQAGGDPKPADDKPTIPQQPASNPPSVPEENDPKVKETELQPT